jgi:hypothetical protein
MIKDKESGASMPHPNEKIIDRGEDRLCAD